MFAAVVLPWVCSVKAVAQERGKASYYANKFMGRRTSSGVPYHKDSLFCAHLRHPFGTLLKVVNPRNGKSVVVKVVDRGPHARGRIIDLSYRAARELGIIAAGVAMVEVSVYRPDRGVPYKPNAKEEEPEIDYEITEGIGFVPEWQEGKSIWPDDDIVIPPADSD